MSMKTEIPHPFPDRLVEEVARRFRVLGEPMRIRLVEAMREGEVTVKHLQEATGASQQNVSQHLGVLLRSNIVGRRKQGNFSYYRIIDPVVFSLCDEVCGGLRRQIEELDALLEGGG
jgi:DNA-binding transcriptional ArsR family regulator